MSGGAAAEGHAHGAETRLLALLAALVEELRGRREPVRWDSRLDRDLGLDSLARVELILRLEAAFRVSLPESVLADAETPRDLLRAITAAGGHRAVVPVALPAEARARGRDIPAEAKTLIDVLAWHAERTPAQVQVYLYDGDEPSALHFGELYDDARRLAAGLRREGVAAGEVVALMLPTGRAFLATFFGVLLAGAVPAPLYPPVRRAALEEHARRQATILNNCEAPLFITVDEVRALSPLLKGLAPRLRAVVTHDQLMADAAPLSERPARVGADIALLQYTSGSTGDPKGVVLTHANLLANIRSMGAAVAVRPDEDVFVSWLPLYHDMGLIGACLGSLYYGMPLVLMSPLAFMARPQRWLRAIQRHRGTLSAGPNFAYELCATKLGDDELAGLDLSSWRVAFNGAEQVSAETLQRFAARYARYGFRAEALAPVYGLAESSVGLAFPPLGRGPRVDIIDRARLMTDGLAAPGAGAVALHVVGCGRPLPGHEIRVVDARGRLCEERREGRVQFRGPSSCQGYFRNAEATARLFVDGWLESGDRGYLVDGEIFITGRIKDIIIRGGHNIYPYELEEAVAAIDGIRRGGVAAFASRDEVHGTERLVIVAETRERRPEARERLRAAVNEAVSAVIANPPDEVVLAPPRAVLKTSSGKVRRDATRRRYEAGLLEAAAPALWRQGLRLAWAGAGTWLRRGAVRTAAGAYAVYAWSVFAGGAFAAIAGVATLPTTRARQRWCKAVARVTAAAAGLRLALAGHERLAGSGACVVVANHASYIDAMVLVALLPPGLHYVAKRELADQPIVGWCLRRYGCEFVERSEVQQSAAAARALAERVRAGRSLLFFPEGTFGPAPGLRPFRMGAFVAAAGAGVPVVPVALSGTRAILPSGTWRPRRGAVTVAIGVPLRAEGEDWRAAVALRDRARREIARASGEVELQPL